MEQTNYSAPLRPEFQLKHIYYYKENEGGDLCILYDGWAFLFSFRHNKVLFRYTYTGLPNDRRYIAYVDRKVFVTNCTWALNIYDVGSKTNTESYGYSPFPGRKIARNLAKYFPTKEDCLDELQKHFRECLGDPTADIRDYQSEDMCFLWPGTDEKSDYILLYINGVHFNLAHLLLYAIDGILLHETDEHGEFKIFPGRDRSDIDASHLCYLKSCIVSKRIVFETQTSNNRRNFCRGAQCNCGMVPPCFRGPFEALPGVESATFGVTPNDAKRKEFKKILADDQVLKVEFPLYTPLYYNDGQLPFFYGNTNRYAIPNDLKEYYRKDFMSWGINCAPLSNYGNTTVNCESLSKKGNSPRRSHSRKRKWTHMTPEYFASKEIQPSVSSTTSTAQRTSTLTTFQGNANFFTTTVDSDNGPMTLVRTSMLQQNNTNQLTIDLTMNDDVPTQQLAEQQQEDDASSTTQQY